MTSQTPRNRPAQRRRADWRPFQIRSKEGHKLAVFSAGRAEADAPTLVLVHGIGHWAQAAWDYVASEFEATHRIVAFDLPGFGASEKPDVAYALGFFSAALRAVVERCELERFALVGHSLGGLIAADYAATYPQEVRLLGLVDPAGFARTPQLALRVVACRPIAWLAPRIRPSRRFVRRIFERAVYDAGCVPEDYHVRAYELSQDPEMTRAFIGVYRDAAHDFLHMRALHARLGGYRGPALVVWGRRDRYVSVRALPAVRRVYPHADVCELEHCGHCPNLEYPEVIAARLRRNGA